MLNKVKFLKLDNRYGQFPKKKGPVLSLNYISGIMHSPMVKGEEKQKSQKIRNENLN